MKEEEKNKGEKLTPEEELQAENQIRALKHELEFGSKTFISGETPPEIVAQFFDHIEEYDRLHNKAAMVKLYDLIGNPPFRPKAEIPEDELETEIEYIINILLEHNITIDRPEHLSALGFYDFLTTDLFNEEMMDIHMPGLRTNFIYDEIRQDGPEFIKENAEAFIQEMLNLDIDFKGDLLAETCRNQHMEIPRSEAMNRILEFRQRYRKIVINGFSADRTQLTEKGMFFFFGLVWQGFPVDFGETELHKGLGVCQMELSEHNWWVKGFIIPGFNL